MTVTADTSAGQGLSETEAARRLAEHGYNEIPERTRNPVLKFLSYLWGPIPWMIEAAAVLSGILRHVEDLVIILVLLLANAVVGFWEEYQAGNTVAALKQTLALRARVLRDGAWRTIEARELVPGDVVRLRLGEIVPADACLLQGDPIQVDQSALTGESLPVQRGPGEEVYSGSIVKQGEIEADVTATGATTYFGKTAGLVEEAHTVSHFQRAVLKIGDYLIVVAITLVALILTVALFRHDAMLTVLQFALVLTVAAIPVAMPTVLSVTMAVGARLLATKQAIVTRLAAVEELAGVDVLCSDKTGTLTQNRLTLGQPFTVEGVSQEETILAAALASRAEDQDPIDLAVLSGVGDGARLHRYAIEHFQPFDPVSKRTEAVVRAPDGASLAVTKGAPQVILALCADAGRHETAANDAIAEFARRGFRSLGVARRGPDPEWHFLGILPLYDPPRPDSKETLRAAREMGLDVKMVTGDQVAIAREIAGELGLSTNILDAGFFGTVGSDDRDRLADAVEHADGFAQVFPEHKYAIVDALQRRRHIVGMTGDGVNDAPALKKADAGVAVSGATDAARAAADIVLLTPGLAVVIDAIRESRKIFRRMNSYAIYRIAETIRVLLFMTLSILVFNFYPVTAIMIVLLALLNDGSILAIAYDHARPSSHPDTWKMPTVLGVASTLGVIGVVASFVLFFIAEQVLHLDRGTIQSLMYLKLSVAAQLTIFLTRTRGPFWSDRPASLLIGAVATAQGVATLITVFGIFVHPIGWALALMVWGYALAWFLVNDRVKLFAYRVFDHEGSGLLDARLQARAGHAVSRRGAER